MKIRALAHSLRTAAVSTILSVPAIGLQTSATQVSNPQTAAPAYSSHDIAGDWQGTLEFPVPGHPNARYRLVLRIAKAPDGGWTALNYSIDQSPEPMHTSDVSLKGSTFKFSIPSLHGSYEGNVSADGSSIRGVWTQGGSSDAELCSPHQRDRLGYSCAANSTEANGSGRRPFVRGGYYQAKQFKYTQQPDQDDPSLWAADT